MLSRLTFMFCFTSMMSTLFFSLQPSSPPITTRRELGELIVFIFHSSFSTKICSCIIIMPLRLQTMDRSIVNPFAPKEVKQTFVTIVQLTQVAPSIQQLPQVFKSCPKYSKVVPNCTKKNSKVVQSIQQLPQVVQCIQK